MQGYRQHELPMAVGDSEAVGAESRGNRAIGEDPVRFNPSTSRVDGVPGSGLKRGSAHERWIIEDHPVACYAAQFAKRPTPIGGMHQHAQTDRRIERAVGESQIVRVAWREGNSDARILRATLGDGQHLARSIDPGHARATRGKRYRRTTRPGPYIQHGPAGAPIVLYTGTFEAYQGLDLLFAAARQVVDRHPGARFVLAGGRPDQIAAAREQAERLGIGSSVAFAGQRPAEDIPAFLDAADALVSPRSTGTNTPLKIYQYLRSGRPIVATRLLTHTQVLNDDVAILTAATPEGFAAGILAALSDRDRARAVGDRARELADTKYSYEAYLAQTRQMCTYMTEESTPQVAGGLA